MGLREAALEAAGKNWKVFPLQERSKQPLGKDVLQNQDGLGGFYVATSDPARVEEWWTSWPQSNVGLRTGVVSGLVVVDVDKPEMEEDLHLPETLRAKTGKGRHHYYRVDDAVAGSKYEWGDVKADGGYVLLAPSIHPSGAVYTWENLGTPLAPLPEWLRKSAKEVKPSYEIPDIIPEGQREAVLLSLAGTLRKRGASAQAIAAALEAENERCDPPLPAHALARMLKSAGGWAVEQLPPYKEGGLVGNQYDDAASTLDHCGVPRPRLNVLTGNKEVDGRPVTEGWLAAARIAGRNEKVGANEMFDALSTVAEHDGYNPVLEKLVEVERQYDGGQHIRALAGKLGVEERQLRTWLEGAVRRAYEPGFQLPMLILDGPQGKGKSFFVSWLGKPFGGYTHEGPIDPQSVDHQRWLVGKFLWEVSELGNTTRKSDRDALKDFLSKGEAEFRLPYDRGMTVRPALACFIATANLDGQGLLNDPTGYRRFWPMPVQEIDWTYATEIDPEQVWGEAAAGRRGNKAAGQFSYEERAAADQVITERYVLGDLVEDRLLQRLEVTGSEDDWLPTSDLAAIVGDLISGGDMMMTKRVASIMVKWGCKPYRRTKARVSGYVGIRRRSGKDSDE